MDPQPHPAAGREKPAFARHWQAATISIGVTRESCAALRELGARRVEQLPQAALSDEELAVFDRFPPPPSGPFRAICMGRLLHWKGFHLAIRAFGIFAAKNPDAELWRSDDGPFRPELEKIASQTGAGSRIRFFGRLPRYADVLEKLAQSHVLVHPALHEGFGNVCYEALAAGRPVVCLDIGGPASQASSETGFVALATTPAESVESMAAFLHKVANDRPLLARMSVKAREKSAREVHHAFTRCSHRFLLYSSCGGTCSVISTDCFRKRLKTGSP